MFADTSEYLCAELERLDLLRATTANSAPARYLSIIAR